MWGIHVKVLGILGAYGVTTAGTHAKVRLITSFDSFWQVSVQKANKEKQFAKRYPAAAKQITSPREMEAGLL